jgi:hypothetical protein
VERPKPREFVDHLLTVATEGALITVRVPEAHIAAMNGGLDALRNFGTPVSVAVKPVVGREFGRPIAWVEPVGEIHVPAESGELVPVSELASA